MFTAFKDLLKQKRKEDYERKYVILEDGSEKHVTEFADRSVSIEEDSALRMNSYAREDFIKKIDDENLIHTAYHYMNNSRPHKYPCSTYDEAVVHVVLPELLQRFEELLISDESKEQSSMDYYNKMKEYEDELKRLNSDIVKR